MSKKTFISNQELELTQKIQLQFPRGLIPPEVLTYWENCPPDILRIILRDAFYFLENVNDPRIKVRRPIPLKLPHNEDNDGYFFYSDNTDLSDKSLFFNVNEIKIIKAKEIKPFDFPDRLDSRRGHPIDCKSYLDMFQLWAIYLRGYDFFVEHFSGIVYSMRSAFVSNDDIYFLGVSIDISKERSLRISWYSFWNNFTNRDFFLKF
jgi:hypothetical protein